MKLTFPGYGVTMIMSTKQKTTMKPSPGSIKATVQNNTTGLFLCPKGYWNDEERTVVFPDKFELSRSVANLNATVRVLKVYRENRL